MECLHRLSHGSGEAARLTLILESDSPESFWMCERSKAMAAARWTCTTIKLEERWDLRMRLMILILASVVIKTGFHGMGTEMLLFPFRTFSRFVQKSFLAPNLSLHHVLHHLSVSFVPAIYFPCRRVQSRHWKCFQAMPGSESKFENCLCLEISWGVDVGDVKLIWGFKNTRKLY